MCNVWEISSVGGDVSNGIAGAVKRSLGPPVEECLSVRGPILKVIDNKPIEGLAVESIVDFMPLGGDPECEVKL